LFRNRWSPDGSARQIPLRVRRAVRRGLTHVGPYERMQARATEQREALERLVGMYERLRRNYAARRAPAATGPSGIPSASEIEAVEDGLRRVEIFRDFFSVLAVDGDFSRAAVSMTRRLVGKYRDRGGNSRARIIAQVFQQYDELRPIAEICLALCAFYEPLPESAWALFTRNDLDLVVKWAAGEYFELAFRRDPDAAQASLRKVLGGEVALDADADVWLRIAYHSFAAGALELAEETLARAETAVTDLDKPALAEPLRNRLSTLREWLDRARRAQRPVEVTSGEIPFALVGFRHPDADRVSGDLEDPIETLAALGHLLRRDGVRFTGDPALVASAEQLRRDVPAGRRVAGEPATVRLYEVDRDLSRYAAVPDGTWVIVSEWFTAPLAGWRYDMPLDARLRPLFISFHITPAQLNAPGVIDYLRRYAPIGCRDRDTVFLLHAASVPAFFSGALTMTVDTAVPPADGEPTGSPATPVRPAPEVRHRELGENLAAAADALRGYRDGGARIVTADLRRYLAARAVGARAEFRLADPADYRAIDFVDLPDEEFASMRNAIADKLDAVLGAVLAGREADAVYQTWRELCAAEVAKADAELHTVGGNPELNFDLDEACRMIRAASVVIERSEPGPDGPEVNVEFSVDGNYKHQLDIVLDSVVQRASRPVRAYVLCRGVGADHFERMARLFPTVSFVWLPTDSVQYGEVRGKIKWATIVTMDRTILSVLLDDVDRIIHFDLDAMCLADLAELFDVEMDGKAIAAADEPQLNHNGGFNSYRGSAARLRSEGKPELARELILRTHSDHPFDYTVFNAGIMVLDLAKMRADDFCGRYLAYVQRFGINGQAVLNFYVGRERKKLDGTWNRLVRLEVSETPKIPHWAGPFKPWGRHQYVARRELWREQEQRFAARIARLEQPVESVG
jgi:lipopolysaccharide biosynthesis glycosyltransferase